MRVILFIQLLTSFSLAQVKPEFDGVDQHFNKSLQLNGIQKNSSYCVVTNDLNLEQVAGHRVSEKVRIASVTKLFTTYFVLSRLGKDFRFVTRFNYDPSTQHLHISGSRDPFMGERAMHFIVAKLNENKIYSAKKITFSEDFSFFRKVEYKSDFYTEHAVLGGNPEEITRLDLITFFQNPMRQYAQTRSEALKIGIKLPEKIQFQVSGDIDLVEGRLFKAQAGSIWFDYFSSSILGYLKELNKWSMNYIADEIVQAMGGMDEMNDFFRQRFSITRDELELHTASGLELYLSPANQYTTNSDNGRNRRVDNWATCDVVVTVLASLQTYLENNKLKLSDVMLVGGLDRGTFLGSENIENSVLAKTGTLNSTIALAGYISTNKSPYLFGIFFDIKDKSFQGIARNQSIVLLEKIAAAANGKKEFAGIAVAGFMPFDKNSLYSVRVEPEMGLTMRH